MLPNQGHLESLKVSTFKCAFRFRKTSIQGTILFYLGKTFLLLGCFFKNRIATPTGQWWLKGSRNPASVNDMHIFESSPLLVKWLDTTNILVTLSQAVTIVTSFQRPSWDFLTPTRTIARKHPTWRSSKHRTSESNRKPIACRIL